MGPLFSKRRPPRPRRILPTSQCPQHHKAIGKFDHAGLPVRMSGTALTSAFQPCSRSRSRSVMTPCTRPPQPSPPERLTHQANGAAAVDQFEATLGQGGAKRLGRETQGVINSIA